MRALWLMIASAKWFYTALMITMMNMNCNDNKTMAPVVRPATQAGRFYDGNAHALTQNVDSLMARHANDSTYQRLAALIVPHAGHYFSGNVAAAAYMSIPAGKQYKRIFLIGPSHYEWLDGASVNNEADYYATPLGQVAVDRETADQLICADSVFGCYPKAHDREHCLEVQLPFLQRRMGDMPPIVPIIVSTNDYAKLQRMADVLRPYLNDDNLFVISSDFSHYPRYEDARKVDAKTAEAIMTGDVSTFIATLEENSKSGMTNLQTSACGEFPIIVLMLMLDNNYQIHHLLYQNSGDIDSQSRNRVVGYHAFAIERSKHHAIQKKPADNTRQQGSVAFTLSSKEQQLLREIARESIVAAVNGKKTADMPNIEKYPTLQQKCGAFVTLTQHGRLRGCIGLLSGSLPLHETVRRMARAAALEDPRFNPLRREELDDTDIEISVITPMQRIHSLDELELHRHGIFIKKGNRSGTFLPQVADEVDWTKEEFVGHCSRDKAGLGWDGWRDAELYVYEAIVF